ncbi:hypothetical protein V6N12_016095 [Hibiscus sabdariffa]|uniref:RNase H type-1 domain-containing protein n=1 Tax=Hibiscus sabdariffa TaxID=183260 RepID=A0ABR1ZTZ5_9ROSI
MDCSEVIRLLQDNCYFPGTPTILRHVRRLIEREWTVKFQYIPREQNKVAHALAKLACVSHLDVIYFHVPPYSIGNVEQDLVAD